MCAKFRENMGKFDDTHTERERQTDRQTDTSITYTISGANKNFKKNEYIISTQARKHTNTTKGHNT